MTCRECQFWKPQFTRERSEDGQCRRRAPVLITVKFQGNSYRNEGEWPSTYHKEWCGDFALATPENTEGRA